MGDHPSVRLTLRIILYILTLALGGVLLAFNLNPDLAVEAARLVATREGQWVSAGLAAFMFVSPLVTLLRWFQSIRRHREISYQTDGGKISVSLLAIEEALTRAIEGEVEVKKAHVRVFEDRVKRAVIIEAVVTLWEVPNVTDRNRFCQRLLRRRFAELMPEQNQVQVNLHLHRLTERRIETKTISIKSPKSPVTLPELPATEPEAMEPGQGSGINPVAGAMTREPDELDLYVGPSYPVDHDDDDDDEPTTKALRRRR